MKRIFFLSGILLLVTIDLYCQVNELNVPLKQKEKTVPWSAIWISNPDASATEYGVTLFRKTFELAVKPQKFIIHVTADNHYKLYVNGNFVCMGPQYSDTRHWRYETIDIAGYLQAGQNVIASEVVNWGKDRWFGIISSYTGFLLEGDSEEEKIACTDDKSWKTFDNKAYNEKRVNWMFGVDILGGFYASNPTDSVIASFYPWGWEQQGFDDSNWKTAVWLSSASTRDGSFAWILMPRTTPIPVMKKQLFTKIAHAEGITVPAGFLSGEKPLIIPANKKVTILIDQTYETIGYPQVIISGGKNAILSIGYAENLFDKNLKKGNRNDITDKHFVGIRDIYIPDGGQQRHFEPLWFRSFRFVYLEITTRDEPLEINQFYNRYISTPVETKASFSCDNKKYDKVWDICERTLHICTQDNFISDAYYEQMMYVGDSRVHSMSWMYLTGDTLQFRNAIDQFWYSRIADGNLNGCYPNKGSFPTPTFSLIWIDMLHDYFMYCTDKKILRQYLPAVEMIFDWFEQHKNDSGIPGKTEWGYFVDWYQPGSGGTAPVSVNGNSATITLHLINSLQNASEIFRYYGMNYEADKYLNQSQDLRKIVLNLFYDPVKGVIMEDPGKTYYDQHCNIIAVNVGLVPLASQQHIIKTILSDTLYSVASLYYRFNLFNAMNVSQTGDEFEKAIQLWYDKINLGLTTTPEMVINERSDCHPWATGPVYGFFHVICGISPAEPGFNTITIAPQLGNLNNINATFPHRYGNVEIKLERKNNHLTGEITLPEKLSGTFKWKGHEIALFGKKNLINLPNE